MDDGQKKRKLSVSSNEEEEEETTSIGSAKKKPKMKNDEEETIKKLQERSGAKIKIIQDSAELANEKPLRITGDPNDVETARQLVTEILNQNDERDMGGAGGFGGRGRGRGNLFAH